MYSNRLSILMLTLCGFSICHKGYAVPHNHTSYEMKIVNSNFLGENCKCPTQWQCECCANVNNDLLNVHQKLCADWLIFSNSWNIRANVRLNENILYTNTFSAWSIPPFCVPLWPALGLTGCLQLHSIAQHEDNTLHGCGNVTINFITFTLINWPIGCMDVGSNGIQIVEPNHDAVNATTNEKPPEIELVTSEFIQKNNLKKTIQCK